MAQALKANEDLAVKSLNLANNFFTKFGQVSLVCFHLSMVMYEGIPNFNSCLIVQVALSEARDHVYDMSEKEIDIYF